MTGKGSFLAKEAAVEVVLVLEYLLFYFIFWHLHLQQSPLSKC